MSATEKLSTNERLAGQIALLIAAEFVLSILMLILESVVAANPGGPFGKGHLYEPIFIGMLSFLSLLARFACAVLWCWWSIRIMSVVRADGVTPWSLAWWFVPGFNLVMPYLAIRELWKGAVANVRVPVFLHVWWGFWTIHLLAYGLVIGLSSSFSSPPAPDSVMVSLFLVRDAALLVAAPLAIALIVRFNRVVPDPEHQSRLERPPSAITAAP